MPRKTMSPRQIEANRANARKSTGPKTPEGKARSARNAVKHGLTARNLVIPDDSVEDPADFQALLDDLTTEIDPQTLLERLLVQRIAICHWRLNRALRFETASIANGRAWDNEPTRRLALEATGLCPPHDPERIVLPSGDDLERLVRYENMINRELNRAMTRLDQIRAAPSPPSRGGLHEDRNTGRLPESNPCGPNPSPAPAPQHYQTAVPPPEDQTNPSGVALASRRCDVIGMAPVSRRCFPPAPQPSQPDAPLPISPSLSRAFHLPLSHPTAGKPNEPIHRRGISPASEYNNARRNTAAAGDERRMISRGGPMKPK